MKRVLLLAYHFPPIGGAPAQRVVQLCRTLRTLGFEPVVLTGSGTIENRWAPIDAELLARLPPDLEVHRLQRPHPVPRGAWEARLERWAGVPQAWVRWWYAEVSRMIRSTPLDVDLVHATIAPYAVARTALRVAHGLEVPLVVDLEDPWALDEMMMYPTALHRRIDRVRMGKTLTRADAVIMNTEEAKRRVRDSFPELRDRPVAAIPNGFDAADFEGEPDSRTDGTFRIVHTGSLHTDLGLRHRRASRLERAAGRAVAGVDFLTRSHVFLLAALERVVQQMPELVPSIEVHFAGVLTERDREIAGRFPVRAELHGFLSHSETVRLIRLADLLFLPLHDVPPGTRAGIVPQKTYEYVASGRPILAAVPPGDARDLLEAAGTARCCDPSDVDAIVANLVAELTRWRRGEPVRPARADVVARHESRTLGAQVARVYGEVLGPGGAPHLA